MGFNIADVSEEKTKTYVELNWQHSSVPEVTELKQAEQFMSQRINGPDCCYG